MEKIFFEKGIEENKISRAVSILQRGGVLIHPTENIYGFGALISEKNAIERIHSIKKRENAPQKKHGYIVLIGELKQLKSLVSTISPVEARLIKRYWPGPLTIIFSASKSIEKNPACYKGKIAVRYVGNPITQEIIRQAKCPIISTSINISGEKPLTDIDGIINWFGSMVDGIVIDKIHQFTDKPSTVIKVEDGKPIVIRKGAIDI
jgi:L-threonylcarbamoyladenylate synthase